MSLVWLLVWYLGIPMGVEANVVDYRQQIVNYASQYGVPAEIALSVAQQETRVQHYDNAGNVIRGRAGEVGMFQLLPTTAQAVGVDPFNPSANIEGGVKYLARVYNMTGGNDWESALQAYNGGIGNWLDGTVSAGARGYAQEVLGRTSVRGTASMPARSPVGRYTGQPGGQPADPVGTPSWAAGGGYRVPSWLASWDFQALELQDPVFRATATAQRPRTALLVILGLLGVYTVSQVA